MEMNPNKVHYKTFTLSGDLTPEQINFFNRNGFIHFKHFLKKEEVGSLWKSISSVHEDWIRDDKQKINGIPVVFGQDKKGNKIIQRSPFTSQFSKELHDLIKSGRLKPFVGFLPNADARLTENEKDGVVVNHYINHKNSELKQMGWHTDSARDIFYFQKVQPMLNVGIYLTDSTKAHGGLRVLPGTHRQNVSSLLLRC